MVHAVVEVIEKGIATTNMSDQFNEHCILQGQHYIIGKWLQFKREMKNYVQYKKPTGVQNALINISELFYTNVVLNKRFQMSITDYRLMCCQTF